jgi:tetratricopeptide (TPR) repeat protein
VSKSALPTQTPFNSAIYPEALNLLRHFFRPARGGAAAVIIVFALLLALAAKAGFIGIPLALILNSWFFKYAFILFDHSSRGFDEPPVLDVKMMNPIDEQRPLAQLFIILLLAGADYWVHGSLGAAAAVIFAIICLFSLPASVAILGLEGNFFKALNPLAWAAMIKGLGPLYLVVLTIIFVCALIISALTRLDIWPSIRIAIGMFGILSIFSVLGGALYERRDQLGIHTWVSPEQEAEKLRKEDHAQNEKLVHDAYGLMRAGRHTEAWQLLQRWLAEHAHAIEAYAWICESVNSWEDKRYLTRLSQEHIERLLDLKRAGEALDLTTRCLAADPAFRPKSAAATLQIAQLAARGGGLLKLARTLTSDFATRFPDDPHTATAAALARQL